MLKVKSINFEWLCGGRVTVTVDDSVEDDMYYIRNSFHNSNTKSPYTNRASTWFGALKNSLKNKVPALNEVYPITVNSDTLNVMVDILGEYANLKVLYESTKS